MRVIYKRISKGLFYVLLFIFALLLFFGVSSKITGDHPTIFGQRMLIVLSGSMEPKIQTGSVVFDNPNFSIAQLKVGDIITFVPPTDPNILITHRIYRIVSQKGQEAFMTKGDANAVPDGWIIPTKNVVAEYDHFTIPYLGYYLEFLQTKIGIGLMLIVPGLLLIITQVIQLVGAIRKESSGKKVVDVK